MKDRRKKEDIKKKKHLVPQVLHFYSLATNQRRVMEKSSSILNAHLIGKCTSYQRCPVDTGAAHADSSQQHDCLSLKGVPATWEIPLSWSALIQT